MTESLIREIWVWCESRQSTKRRTVLPRGRGIRRSLEASSITMTMTRRIRAVVQNCQTTYFRGQARRESLSGQINHGITSLLTSASELSNIIGMICSVPSNFRVRSSSWGLHVVDLLLRLLILALGRSSLLHVRVDTGQVYFLSTFSWARFLCC